MASYLGLITSQTHPIRLSYGFSTALEADQEFRKELLHGARGVGKRDDVCQNTHQLRSSAKL